MSLLPDSKIPEVEEAAVNRHFSLLSRMMLRSLPTVVTPTEIKLVNSEVASGSVSQSSTIRSLPVIVIAATHAATPGTNLKLLTRQLFAVMSIVPAVPVNVSVGRLAPHPSPRTQTPATSLPQSGF